MSWEYFSENELQCKCGCGKENMNEGFMSKLQALRKTLNFPFPISSGFRCADYNKKISSSGVNGPHTTGRAVDIKVNGLEAYKLLQYAASFQMNGIGLKQSGDHEQRYIHLDDLTEHDGFPRPTIWTY